MVSFMDTVAPRGGTTLTERSADIMAPRRIDRLRGAAGGMECERGSRGTVRFRPRPPSWSVHYRTVQVHRKAWLAPCCEGRDDGPAPHCVEHEFRRCLAGGGGRLCPAA